MNELSARFARPRGIADLWGRDRHLGFKWLLFRGSSEFFQRGGRDAIRRAASEAAVDPEVQKNFLEFLRLLALALKGEMPVVSPEEADDIAKDREMIAEVWQAATATPLQPRMQGSMNDVRRTIAESCGSEEQLPLPSWWR